MLPAVAFTPGIDTELQLVASVDTQEALNVSPVVTEDLFKVKVTVGGVIGFVIWTVTESVSVPPGEVQVTSYVTVLGLG